MTLITVRTPSDRQLAVAGSLFETARPRQWVKNAFVLAPVIFSGEFVRGRSLLRALLAAAAFTLVSAGTYFLNDFADRRFDRQHPLKRHRPIASGRLSPRLAVAAGTAAGGAGLALGACLNLATLSALVVYGAVQSAYTLALKHLAILDVLAIALGFVLRVIAGAAAIGVAPSNWLLACTLFLATFLGFAKRAGEAVRIGGLDEAEGPSRPVLIVYHDRLLLALLSASCAVTLLSYALYAVEREPPSSILLATVPVVTYALFRYLLLTLHADQRVSAESPENLILRDPGLILAGLLWAGMCVVAMGGTF